MDVLFFQLASIFQSEQKGVVQGHVASPGWRHSPMGSCVHGLGTFYSRTTALEAMEATKKIMVNNYPAMSKAQAAEARRS
jgi:hypothetical protein